MDGADVLQHGRRCAIVSFDHQPEQDYATIVLDDGYLVNAHTDYLAVDIRQWRGWPWVPWSGE
jgi:hypothetical protein